MRTDRTGAYDRSARGSGPPASSQRSAQSAQRPRSGPSVLDSIAVRNECRLLAVRPADVAQSTREGQPKSLYLTFMVWARADEAPGRYS